MRWKLRKNGDFEIWSFYSVFRWPSSIVFPWKAILGVKAPRRVSFFVWTTALGKILTADNLRKSSYFIVDWCCMCRCDGEFVNHLLIHCGVALQLWSFVFRSFGVAWVLLEMFDGCIWRDWNRCTFEDMKWPGGAAPSIFMGTLFDWSRAWGLTSSDSIRCL